MNCFCSYVTLGFTNSSHICVEPVNSLSCCELNGICSQLFHLKWPVDERNEGKGWAASFNPTVMFSALKRSKSFQHHHSFLCPHSDSSPSLLNLFFFFSRTGCFLTCCVFALLRLSPQCRLLVSPPVWFHSLVCNLADHRAKKLKCFVSEQNVNLVKAVFRLEGWSCSRKASLKRMARVILKGWGGVAHLALQHLQVQTLLLQFVLLLLDLLHQLVNSSVLSRHQHLDANGKNTSASQHHCVSTGTALLQI